LDYVKELFRKWYIFFFFLILFGALAAWYISIRKNTYTAKLTLMTNQEKGNRYAPLMQIMGQFGMSGGSEGVDADKIIELLFTRLIISSALFKTDTINKKTDLLVNHFIKEFNAKAWYDGKPALQNIVFKTKADENFTVEENKIVQDIYKEITEHHLTAGTSDNGIVEVNYKSISEPFAKIYLDNLYETLSEYYISKSNQKQRETFDIVKYYNDSLQNALRRAEAEWAILSDKNVFKVKNEGRLNQLRKTNELEALNVAYIESVKNLELAKFNLINQTPILQLIDRPVFPLKENKTNYPLIIFAVLVLTFFFSVIVVVLNKIVKDALKNE